jgi:chromosome segregation ATPase
MGLTTDLDKLSRAIKDADISLFSVKARIEQLDKEIAILAPRKNELEQNIEFLKKQDTIPLAQEFKKSKAELAKTSSRLNIIVSERVKVYQASLDIEMAIAKFKRDHDQLIIGSENNILKIDFGGKRGKR